MADVVYITTDVGLDSVSIAPRDEFVVTGTRSRITPEGDRESFATFETTTILDGDILRVDVFNSGTLVDTFEGDAISLAEPSDIGYSINLYDILVNGLDIFTGRFQVTVYIVRKIQELSVLQISTNKKEIKLNSPLVDIRELGDEPIPVYLYHNNTGGLHPIINWVRDEYGDGNLIVKHTPHDGINTFPRTIRVNDDVEIWDQVINPLEFEVFIRLPFERPEEGFNRLRGPDFYIDINRQVGKGTGVLTEAKILNAVPDVKNRIVNRLFSGSIGNAAELNIDYRNFENFIHFSSAEQRIRNFYYKMRLIETYTSQSLALESDLSGLAASGATGSFQYVRNRQTISARKEAVISNFDEYEKYLYYESGSEYTDTYGTFKNVTWPKTNSTKPYTNASINSSAVQTWYTSRLDDAEIYDNTNKNILRDLIPLHVRFNPQNNGFVLFVDMIAQHFDVLYNYVDHLGKLHEHDEDVNTGLSKDLLWNVLKSMGWEAVSGWDKEDLWKYFLGTDASGSYQTTSSAEYPDGAQLVFATTESVSYRDMEMEPYSRIFNNLPYIYKTKGSARSIKALLSAYGIPSSILRIQEFGGPDPINSISGSQMQALEIANHELITSASYVRAPWGNLDKDGEGGVYTGDDIYTPRTIEFRFRTNQKVNQGLFSKTDALAIWMEHSSSVSTSNYGRLHLSLSGSAGWVSASTQYLPIYDNDYYNVALRVENRVKENGTEIDAPPVVFELDVRKSPNHADGRITHTAHITYSMDDLGDDTATSSYLDNWGAGGQNRLNLGFLQDVNAFSITPYTRSFNGAFQEFRLWRSYLPDWVLDGHAQAPISYYASNYSESFDNLVLRLPLGTDNNIFNISGSNIIVSSSHPSQITQFASPYTASGQANNYQANKFNTVDDTYYIHVPNSIGLRPLGNKIRIEDNSVDYTLDPFKSYERSSFDKYPLDSNMVSVAFSPQDNIDLDIALQFGGLILDDIVGDPRDRYSDEYGLLRNIRDTYFKKFDKENNFFVFFRLLSLFNSAIFKQIEQLLPARAHKVVGVMVKPSVLERPKIVTEPSVSLENNFYTTSIDIYDETGLATSDDYDSMVYTDRFGYSSTYSTLTDEIYTWDTYGYDTRLGSRYEFDGTITSYGTSSIIFEFDSTAYPTGSMFFVGSNVEFVFTASNALGTNTSTRIYIPSNLIDDAAKKAIALRDTINASSSLISIPLSASRPGGGFIQIFYTETTPRANNVIVYTGSTPNGQLSNLSIVSGFNNGTGSFGGAGTIQSITTNLAITGAYTEYSRLSDYLYETRTFYSSAAGGPPTPHSTSLELSRLHPYGPNSYYVGTKMTSPDFNIDSEDTIDGGPVAEYSLPSAGTGTSIPAPPPGTISPGGIDTPSLPSVGTGTSAPPPSPLPPPSLGGTSATGPGSPIGPIGGTVGGSGTTSEL